MISSITSWYYQCYRVVNNGFLCNIAHFWVDCKDEVNLKNQTLFQNNGDIRIYGYLYMKMYQVVNNAQLFCNVLYHIETTIYRNTQEAAVNIKLHAYISVQKKCVINGTFTSKLLIFDVDELSLCGCTIKCENALFVVCSSSCLISQASAIQIGSNKHDKNISYKLFGNNYQAQQASVYLPKPATFYIKSPILHINSSKINDIKSEISVFLLDITIECNISNSTNLTCNDRFYLLNTEIFNISNSTVTISNMAQFETNKCIMLDSKLLLKGSNISQTSSHCTINVDEFIMNDNCIIDCLFSYFQIKAANETRIYGNISTAECGQFIIYAHNKLILGKTCNIKANLQYANKDLLNDLQKDFDENKLGLSHINRDMYLCENTNKDSNYIRLCSDKQIDVFGQIYGNKLLMVIDSNHTIKIHEESEIQTHDMIARCCEDINISGVIHCKSCLSISCKKLQIQNAKILLGIFQDINNDDDMKKTFFDVESNDITAVNSKHPILRVLSTTLNVENSNISDMKTDKCILLFNIEKNCDISRSTFESNQFNLINPNVTAFTDVKLNTGQIHIDNIDVMQWNKNTICTMSNIDQFIVKTFTMKNDCRIIMESLVDELSITEIQLNINKFKMEENSILEIKCNKNIIGCTINVDEFYLSDNCIINCSVSQFQIKATNAVEISGAINIGDNGQYVIYACNKLILHKTCNINSKLKYNENLVNELNKHFDELQLNDCKNNMYLITNCENKKNDNYIRICSNNQIDIYGRIKGNETLVVVDSNGIIQIHDKSEFNTGSIFIRCCKDILCDGIISCQPQQNAECYFYSPCQLSLEKNCCISSSFAKFCGYDVLVNGILNIEKELCFYVDNICNMQGNISSNLLVFDDSKSDKNDDKKTLISDDDELDHMKLPATTISESKQQNKSHDKTYHDAREFQQQTDSCIPERFINLLRDKAKKQPTSEHADETKKGNYNQNQSKKNNNDKTNSNQPSNNGGKDNNGQNGGKDSSDDDDKNNDKNNKNIASNDKNNMKQEDEKDVDRFFDILKDIKNIDDETLQQLLSTFSPTVFNKVSDGIHELNESLQRVAQVRSEITFPTINSMEHLSLNTYHESASETSIEDNGYSSKSETAKSDSSSSPTSSNGNSSHVDSKMKKKSKRKKSKKPKKCAISPYHIAVNSDCKEMDFEKDKNKQCNDIDKLNELREQESCIKQKILSSKWYKVRNVMIYGRDNASRKMTLSLEKSEFIRRCQGFMNENKTNIKLIPIGMFNQDHNLCELQYLVVMKIDKESNTDIGVSFRYTEHRKIFVTGYHLDSEYIKSDLLLSQDSLNDLQNFRSNISHLRIFGKSDEWYEDKYSKCREFIEHFRDSETIDFNLKYWKKSAKSLLLQIDGRQVRNDATF